MPATDQLPDDALALADAMRASGAVKSPDVAEIRRALELKKAEMAGTRHGWKQQGPWLLCRTCQYEHTQHVGIDKRLVGLDDNGRPILTSVDPKYPEATCRL